MLNREPERKKDIYGREPSDNAGKTLIPKKTVAYLGPVGTYSYLAAQEVFESNEGGIAPNGTILAKAVVDYVAMPSILDVFQKVETGEVSFGVVPIENSIEGMVKDSINLFLTHKVITLKEFTLDIDHCLLSKGIYIQNIKMIRAHTQALGQCRKWIDLHLPRATPISTASNTAGIASLDPSGIDAVIASKKVAKAYGLNVLAEHISDKENNKTLFYVISQNTNDFFNKETLTGDIERRIREDGASKVIFLLEAVDGMGVLRDILSIFAEYKAPVTRIQSLPSGEIGVYYFLVDIGIANVGDGIRGLYAKLVSQCDSVRILGVV